MKRVFLVLIICTFMLSMFPYNNSGIGVFDNIVFAEGIESQSVNQNSTDESKKLQNGSFEQGQTFTGSYYQPNQSAVPYWNTTAFQGKIELLRKNYNVHLPGKTIEPTNGLYAAELNAEEESTLYQNVKTTPSSIYAWGLDHGSRMGTDTMAIIIGPKQGVDPSKPNTNGKDQFMQMVFSLGDVEDLVKKKSNAGVSAKQTVYSKKFGPDGGFLNNDDNKPFSSTPSSIYTEKWDIWVIGTVKSFNSDGTLKWGNYGLNGDDSSSFDLSKYYLYSVPSGQTETVFAFVSVGIRNDNDGLENSKKTYGNFLDNINFKLYYNLSGSTTTHGSAIVADSSNSVSGSTTSEGYQITVNNNLVSYVSHASDLTISAVVNKTDADEGCEFAGVYYTKQDDEGDPVTQFI